MYTVCWNDGSNVHCAAMSAVEALAERRFPGAKVSDIAHERGNFRIYDVTAGGLLVGVVVHYKG